MNPKKLLVALIFMLFVGFSLSAQNEEGVISTINDYSIEAVDFNPNGIKLVTIDNTVMMEFDGNVSFLKFEIINRKGEMLLTKKDVDVRRSQLSTANLSKGTYYIRVFKDDVKDLLKFSKD